VAGDSTVFTELSRDLASSGIAYDKRLEFLTSMDSCVLVNRRCSEVFQQHLVCHLSNTFRYIVILPARRHTSAMLVTNTSDRYLQTGIVSKRLSGSSFFQSLLTVYITVY